MTQITSQTRSTRKARQQKCLKRMVGPNGLEPSTSSVSRKRSNQTELRAYMRMAAFQFYRAPGDYGNGRLAKLSKRTPNIVRSERV
jgi:hypothetical protein